MSARLTEITELLEPVDQRMLPSPIADKLSKGLAQVMVSELAFRLTEAALVVLVTVVVAVLRQPRELAIVTE